ncbi:MAG: hypothetical protein U1E23_06170 [Reyranellaceae bacterium]
MKHVLLIGLRPEVVDYADPSLPPGMTAEKIRAGIGIALDGMKQRGWQAESCLIEAEAGAAAREIERRLAGAAWDCVVIGAGVRLPPRNLVLLETVLNAVRRVAPGAAIAFNTRPEDSADAAARWL